MPGHTRPNGTTPQRRQTHRMLGTLDGQNHRHPGEHRDQQDTDQGTSPTGKLGRPGLGKQAGQAGERIPPLHGVTVTPPSQPCLTASSGPARDTGLIALSGKPRRPEQSEP